MKETIEEKKQRLIKISLKLFTENGFEGTTTSAIAKEANMNTGTLFYIFETKAILINELYRYGKHEIANAILVDYDTETFEELIIQIADKIIDFGLENYEIIKYEFLYYNSPYYNQQIAFEEQKAEIDFMKEIFEKYSNASHKEIDYNFLISYLMQFTLLVVDEIRRGEMPKEKVKYRAKKLLWKGLSFYQEEY